MKGALMEEAKSPIRRLIEEFMKLPGIGPKSAQRIVFYLLKQPKETCESLSKAVGQLREKLTLCSKCNDLTDVDPCRLCRDSRRDHKVICVVEEPFNILSIEKSGGYRGLYHVLHGAISPIDGIGPDQLRIKNLLSRVGEGRVEEIILATNPTTEGEATAIYLSKLMRPLQVKVSRIALGIPVGSDIEFADALTISRALSGRSAM
jgi:recombination protein RecR